MAKFTEIIASDYGVKKKPSTARNSQANSIIGRIHQAIGTIIRSFEVHDTNIDERDPWTRIFSILRFVTRATVDTTIHATPMQLVFGRDTIFNVQHEAN
eukprot:636725-Ditylum_brightwellii.AAC.1